MDDTPTNVNFASWFARRMEYLVWPLALFALFLMCIYAAQPAFFSSSNLISILYYTCLLLPAALGTHMLLVLGLFDLSIGSVAAVARIGTTAEPTEGPN